MEKNQALGLTFFIVLFSICCITYIRHLKTSFILGNQNFEQVGVMAYDNHGDTLYIPVFKRRK